MSWQIPSILEGAKKDILESQRETNAKPNPCARAQKNRVPRQMLETLSKGNKIKILSGKMFGIGSIHVAQFRRKVTGFQIVIDAQRE